VSVDVATESPSSPFGDAGPSPETKMTHVEPNLRRLPSHRLYVQCPVSPLWTIMGLPPLRMRQVSSVVLL